MDTKTQKAIDEYHKGNIKKALAIVSKFKRLEKAEKYYFGRAYESYSNERFYIQIHGEKELENIRKTALELLKKWVVKVSKEK